MRNTSIKSRSNTTNIIVSKQAHIWKIKNWAQWIGCSENGSTNAVLCSDKFYIPVVMNTGHGLANIITCWQVAAFPKRLPDNCVGRKDTLAFRLIGHNDSILEDLIKGTFKFETLEKRLLFGPKTCYEFPTRSLDVASNVNNCIRYHQKKDLTIRVHVNIVTSWKPARSSSLPGNLRDPPRNLRTRPTVNESLIISEPPKYEDLYSDDTSSS